ncbi:hypothetical protein QUA03_15610 [Microcoleus sp. S36b_A4]|uniref:hypothetical protein n=1 Tax=Microcoleus sp. S36b_A4 TaxID=3055420 RepID=UPI002FD64F4D
MKDSQADCVNLICWTIALSHQTTARQIATILKKSAKRDTPITPPFGRPLQHLSKLNTADYLPRRQLPNVLQVGFNGRSAESCWVLRWVLTGTWQM